MRIRFSLGIPILFVALGMGTIFSLPVLVSSIQTQEPPASCKPNLAVNIKKANAILIGSVEAVLAAAPSADVWIEPETWYKGKTSAPYLRVVAQASAPATTATTNARDLHFAAGQPPYLLFLRQIAGGKYRTSKCYGSRLLGTGLTITERNAFIGLK